MARPADTWSADGLQDAIVSQSMDAIVITDRELRVRAWNPAAERLYGIAAADALGHRLRDLVETFDETGRPLDSPAAQGDLEANGNWRQRVVHRPRTGPRTGNEVIVDSLVTLLRDGDGRPVGILGVNRDLTASARLESELAALGSLVLATGRARSRAEVAQAAIEILCRATGAEAGLVTSTESAYEAIASVGANEATIATIVSYGQLAGPLARALEAPDSVVSGDVTTAPLREDVRSAVMADGIEHLMVVGLRLAGRLTGILALGWRQRAPRAPSGAIMQQAAALIAAAMENARLLAAVDSGLVQERVLTRRMRAMLELTRLPTTNTIDDRALENLMARIASTIGADGAVLAWVNGDHLEPGPGANVDRAVIDPLIRRPMHTMPIVVQLLEGAGSSLIPFAPVEVSSAGQAAGAQLGFRSLGAFAVRDDLTLVGVVFAVFRETIERLGLDERTLDAIGRVLDISFGNRRLREVVSASERRYRELFESSPDALVVQSTDDERVVDANPAAIRLYGGPLIGVSVAELYFDEATRPMRDVVDSLGVTQYTGVGRRLDGSTFPEEVDLRPIEIDGQPRMLAIVRDLTERTRMQTELIQAQKMDAIGLLVAGVAHELNNPLAAIVGFSHLLRTDPNLPKDLRGQADLLVQEANRTRVIVQNLLDFARLRPPERVEMALRSLLDSVLGLQSYVLSQHQLTVDVDLDPDLPPLSVDRSQMQQVLINLTVNATQAIRETGRPGTIRIRAREASNDAGPTVSIEIADDGPGVPDAILDRLFVPFVTTKAPGAGTGLGLSVSFGIVRAHGGTLRHMPNPGGGAIFIIELPVAHPAGDTADPTMDGTSEPLEAPEAPVAETAPAGDPDPDPVVRPLRVLVLDDEPSIREFLGRVLIRNGQVPILTDTGAAALEIVRRNPPDAILCDHRMAGMNGTEFLVAVTEIDPSLTRRFAFMSGDVLNPELRDFAESRGVHLLAKPFDISAVGRVVASLVADEER